MVALKITLYGVGLLWVLYWMLGLDQGYTVVSLSTTGRVVLWAAAIAAAVTVLMSIRAGVHPVLESDTAWRLRRDRPFVAQLVLVLSIIGFAAAAAFSARLALGMVSEWLPGTPSVQVARVQDVSVFARGRALCEGVVTVVTQEDSQRMRLCMSADMKRASVSWIAGDQVGVSLRATPLAVLVTGAQRVAPPAS